MKLPEITETFEKLEAKIIKRDEYPSPHRAHVVNLRAGYVAALYAVVAEMMTKVVTLEDIQKAAMELEHRG